MSSREKDDKSRDDVRLALERFAVATKPVAKPTTTQEPEGENTPGETEEPKRAQVTEFLYDGLLNTELSSQSRDEFRKNARAIMAGDDRGAEVASTPNAARDVLAERERQKAVEGWTPAHDDGHTDNELSRAAACYAIGNAALWPWSMRWWKPTDRRRDLVKAGALVLAEIERLDRSAHSTVRENAE